MCSLVRCFYLFFNVAAIILTWLLAGRYWFMFGILTWIVGVVMLASGWVWFALFVIFVYVACIWVYVWGGLF